MTLLVAPLLLSHVLVEVPSSKALLLAQSWRSSPAVAAKPELGLNIDAISEATTAFTEDAPLLFSALRLARKPQAERTAVFASLSEDTGASALSLVECLDKQWSVLALAVAPSLSHADTVEAEASTLASLTERCREYGATLRVHRGAEAALASSRECTGLARPPVGVEGAGGTAWFVLGASVPSSDECVLDASEAAAPFDVEECVVPSPISKECLWTKADEVGAAQRRYESAAVEGFRDSRKGNAF